MWIIAGQDQSLGFKVVHDTLAVISVAFGLGAAWLGVRALRQRSDKAKQSEEQFQD